MRFCLFDKLSQASIILFVYRDELLYRQLFAIQKRPWLIIHIN